MNLNRQVLLGIVLVPVLIVSAIVMVFILTYQEPLVLENLGSAPDFILKDENNQTVTLQTYLGSVLIIDFIYTNCPDYEFCPLSSEKMNKVQDGLLERGYTTDDFHLLSISFDWQYDGPTQMKDYGIKNKANFSVWSFLSGNFSQIEKTTNDYNVFVLSDNASVFLVHNMALTVVDSTGNIRAFHTSNRWTVDEVTNEAVHLINEET
jgi:protein SCO1/2